MSLMPFAKDLRGPTSYRDIGTDKENPQRLARCGFQVATLNGLEPSTSCVTVHHMRVQPIAEQTSVCSIVRDYGLDSSWELRYGRSLT